MRLKAGGMSNARQDKHEQGSDRLRSAGREGYVLCGYQSDGRSTPTHHGPRCTRALLPSKVMKYSCLPVLVGTTASTDPMRSVAFLEPLVLPSPPRPALSHASHSDSNASVPSRPGKPCTRVRPHIQLVRLWRKRVHAQPDQVSAGVRQGVVVSPRLPAVPGPGGAHCGSACRPSPDRTRRRCSYKTQHHSFNRPSSLRELYKSLISQPPSNSGFHYVG